ncbi:hypothetical protein M501DRAFT_1011170 [Patellaria atrata CBS 101060]|uniref:PCI domain-containing protein n=1 Tax=Patellaria atrata CBS 101060 TaxID=1346257 RepID=A0A9P4VRY0_9PEZI|nr:hypothetical protein M501DRAFT_1011170 [Patellaria atrata CBS 101060]
MEQTRALNALEPFLALSKTANSPRAAADLITQATGAPNTYVFAELLQTPNIQGLRDNSQYSGYLKLLEIFSWGTWGDYCSNPGLPELNESQQQKLKLLSLLPLAQAQSNLTYPALQSALSLPNARSLEKLITTAIYANLLTGTLDPAHSTVVITSTSPLRDLPPGSIPTLQNILSAWSAKCTGVLDDLDLQAEGVRRQSRERQQRRKNEEKMKEMVDKAAEEREKEKCGKRGPGFAGLGGDGASGEGEAMDVDDPSSGRGGSRGAKRGGGMGRRFG